MFLHPLCLTFHKTTSILINANRSSTVIVAEGALDIEGNTINSEKVKKVLETNLGHDTRVTILGHVQRGGLPSAYDRIMV